MVRQVLLVHAPLSSNLTICITLVVFTLILSHALMYVYKTFMQWFEDCDPSVLNNCLKALDKIQHQYGCEVYALRLFVYFSNVWNRKIVYSL